MGSFSTAMAAALTALAITASEAGAWDSSKRNPTHPTHSYLTEWAIENSGIPEARQFLEELVEGANTELHELPVEGKRYGVDLNAARLAHKGTNAGCDDIQGWWADSLAAYRSGDKQRAYFVLGIMLHMIEDMGVPAHANGVYHQGNRTEFDNFEFMALSNWKPDFTAVDRADPGYADPARYYQLSKSWAHDDAPDYTDRSSFSKTWLLASAKERALLRNRQARTANVALWALRTAFNIFNNAH